MAKALSADRITTFLQGQGKIWAEVVRRTLSHDILTEDDLQFSIYSSLLNLVTDKKYYTNWKVFNRLYISDEKIYPDLTLFNGEEMSILIELKHEIDRSVVMKDIIEDVKKLINIRSKLKIDIVCICFATIFDPDKVKKEELNRLMEKDSLYSEGVTLIIVDLAESIEPAHHHTWEKEHSKLHRMYRQ
jgi:hypothetical protein